MRGLVLKRNIARLTAELADETNHLKRQALFRRLGEDIAKLAAAPPVSSQQAYDGDYWKSRAEKTRTQARRYHNASIQNHFLKIADGYEQLAERAYEIQRKCERASKWGQ